MKFKFKKNLDTLKSNLNDFKPIQKHYNEVDLAILRLMTSYSNCFYKTEVFFFKKKKGFIIK